jgi:integrase
MPLPTYIYRRQHTYFFRWSVPTAVRPMLGGRIEIRRTLGTSDERTALRLARRLTVALERGVDTLMAAGKTPFHLTVKLFERLIDGTVRLEGLELDPKHPEEEQKLLSALLGTAPKEDEPSTETCTLSKLVEDFMKEGDRSKRWTPKTRQELEAIYALLVEILGKDKGLASLGRKDLVYVKDMLAKLPSNRHKDPRYRDKSVLELAGMSIPKADLLSVGTINKIINRTSSLLKWAAVHGHVTLNYAEGMTLAKSKRDNERRDAYTDAEIRTVIDAAVSGAHGADKVPWRKWIPLIACFTGMRVNEIAQLRVADFHEVDGIAVINVSDEGEGQRVKTSSSRRAVPVHPELVSMGLLAHVEALRSKGVERMWPELSGGRDGFGKTPSRWYGEWRKQLGIAKDFHGLRHSVASRLREADVPEDLVAEILGHSRGTTESFKTYAKGASVRRTYDAIKRLNYNGAQVIPIKSAA